MKRHWYTIKLKYMKGGCCLFESTHTVSVSSQPYILNSRKLKKACSSSVKDERVKHLLCNGTVDIIIVAYLGCFRQEPRKTVSQHIRSAIRLFLDPMDNIAYLYMSDTVNGSRKS